jgi:hypothetical protein
LKVWFIVFYPVYRIVRASIYVGKGQLDIAKCILEGLVDGYKGSVGARRC